MFVKLIILIFAVIPVLSCNKLLKTDQDIEIMFHQLKTEDMKVPLEKFLRNIRSTGLIIERDNRLKGFYQNCVQISDGGCFKEAKLAYEEFHKMVEIRKTLISNCITNRLRIVNFPEFSSNVDVLYENQKSNISGKLSNEFPELEKVDINRWGIAICSVDGQRKFAGDCNVPFTMQNLCKPLLLGLVLKTVGIEAVRKYISFEPTNVGKDIVEINDEGKPFNTMVNSGAIMLCALLTGVAYKGKSVSFIHETYVNFVKELIGDEYLDFKASAYISKKESAHELRCLSYGMKCSSTLPPECDIKTSLDLFLKASSLEVTVESFSIVAATLANGGINPFTEQRILSIKDVKEILSAMYSFGLYQLSGESSFIIGLPMKSSISGGLMLVIPQKMGLAMYSPLINEHEISDRSYHFSQELVKTMKLHHFDNVGAIAKKRFLSKRERSTMCEPYCELLTAAATDDVSKLLRLQDAKADFYATDYFGHTALHVAAVKGAFETVKFLLNNYPTLVNAKDKWNRTPKLYALQLKYYEIAKYLDRLDPSNPIET